MKPVTRKGVAALAAVLMGAVLATSAQAAMRHGPPYAAGPRGGDQFTSVSADPQSGTVMIFQVNARQAAAVNCAGVGPYATLQISHPVTDPVSAVRVDYSGATYSQTVVMNVDVLGSRSGALGHGDALGPKMNASGEIGIPLFRAPVRGETMLVRFGLQVHAGCLPGAVVGLPGSRPVEGGRATFPSVEVE